MCTCSIKHTCLTPHCTMCMVPRSRRRQCGQRPQLPSTSYERVLHRPDARMQAHLLSLCVSQPLCVSLCLSLCISLCLSLSVSLSISQDLLILRFSLSQSLCLLLSQPRVCTGTSSFILSKDDGLPIPRGQTGIVALSGCLSSGYLNAEELTLQKFVHTVVQPDGESELLYNTGDLGVMDHNGTRCTAPAHASASSDHPIVHFLPHSWLARSEQTTRATCMCCLHLAWCR